MEVNRLKVQTRPNQDQTAAQQDIDPERERIRQREQEGVPHCQKPSMNKSQGVDAEGTFTRGPLHVFVVSFSIIFVMRQTATV